MICPHCKTANPDGSVYCLRCGQLLSVRAPDGWADPGAMAPPPATPPAYLPAAFPPTADWQTHPAYPSNSAAQPRSAATAVWIVIVLVLVVAALMALVSGRLSALVSSPPTPTSQIQVSQPPPATFTSIPSTPTLTQRGCATIANFAGAGPPDAGPAFSDITYPDDSVGYVSSTYAEGGYSFVLLAVCANDTNANAVRSSFADSLTAQGWSQSATFPYHGDPSAACGDPYCWVSGSSPQRYTSLEAIRQAGSAVTFTLRLAVLRD